MSSWQKTLYIMVAAQLLSAVGFSMIFPFLPRYVEFLGSSYGFSLIFLVGAVFSAQAITMALAAPVWGALADRFGKKVMVERAMFGGAIMILLMAFANSAEMLVFLRALQGLVTGTAAAANALVASSAPRDKTGYAMGTLQVGLWSGVALGPLLGGVLADAFGYRAAFYITATLLFAGGVLVRWGISERKTTRSEREEKGSIVAEWQHVLGSPGVNWVFFFRFMSWLGRNILVPYLPLFIATLVLSESRVNTVTGVTIALASGAGTLSAVLLGRMADRVGYKRVLISCAAFAAVAYVPQYWVTEVWQLLVLQALTGAAAGGIMPVLSALLNHYTTPGEEGAAFGFDNSVVSLSRAVAPMIGAAIVLVGGYRSLFLGGALLMGITTLLAIWKLPDVRSEALEVALAPGD